MSKKTVEETYKKLSQREHVLERPGMYIGSVKKQMEELWVCTENNFKMEKRMIEYTPGFIKIFDEILTNATDHSFRDSTVSTIKVDYCKNTGEISVWNNGSGIPVELHKEHNMYVPELIFGHLLSGSNYDDTVTRTGAGTNGIGSKASNIYSKKFIIETIDSNEKKRFVQEFSDNMTNKSKPKITNNSGKSYTKITFLPDYKRFDMDGLEDDTILLLRKRVLDCIACTNQNVQIYLNGERLNGKGLTDYTKYFFESERVISESQKDQIKDKSGVVTEYIWEYAIVPYSQYEQVSFVNGNATIGGGKHVDYILYQIINKLKKMIEEKKKIKELKPNFIKDKFFFFLRSTVSNPSFNSQTKEQLTTPSKDFGCNITVSDQFINKLYKSQIVDEIVEFCKMKETLDLAKTTDGKKRNKIFIPKLEDALWAGTAKSEQCTLILTEGDSAKTFALWGRNVVGPERFGTFPLRGKLLNIRDASVSQLMNNEEINNLKQIIGLKQGIEYKNTKDLRYGKIMCLTDADCDGSHIKGLLINLFHYWWPSLIKLNFIETLRTPIIKAIRGKNVLEFYTEQDYIKWKSLNNTTGYHIRYFKGLGTSKKEDAQDTFRRMEQLRINYYYKDKLCDTSIQLAFEKDKNVKVSKNKQTDENIHEQNDEEQNVYKNVDEKVDQPALIKCSDRRKQWLSRYDKDSYIDVKEKQVSYQDFVHKELVHFSIYDNMRSIPSLCDGLKPSQRKILHYMLKKNIDKVIKVAQLSGYVSAETGYHHGEASLQGAIVNMAQTFVGSNNINLLYPDGNHGSRLLCGKDSASPRYIYTKLSDITSIIFDKRDSPLLNYLNDDGIEIEPSWFIPVIPMVLVNGCEGIGTGYSTYIPPYNPKDIVANLLRVLDDKDPLPMTPYFKGFGGTLNQTDTGSYTTTGKWERLSDTQIKITEIPVGTGVSNYKEFLESFVEGNTTNTTQKTNTNTNTKTNTKLSGKKSVKSLQLKDVKNKTRDENNDICFLVEFSNTSDLDELINTGTLETKLKLTKSFTTNNMYLFSEDLILTKYQSPNDILLDFYDIRLDFYKKRKIYIVKCLERELLVLNAKIRFIDEYINGKLDINRKGKEYICSLLEKLEYPKISQDNHKQNDQDDNTDINHDYDYLLRMPLISLSSERIQTLKKEADSKQNDLNTLKIKTEKDLWKQDLNKIMEML